MIKVLRLAFTNGDFIISKSFDFDGEVISENITERLGITNSDDMVIEYKRNMTYWFDNYFLDYGSQKVITGMKNKYTYLINKVAFH